MVALCEDVAFTMGMILLENLSAGIVVEQDHSVWDTMLNREYEVVSSRYL
jgi:hypothetical protein